jgi:hypothetical protein
MNAIFTQILHVLHNQNQRNKMNKIENETIGIDNKDKELFKFFLTIQNLEALENVFDEILQFCKTKKHFAVILENLSCARYAIDDLKYLHVQKDEDGRIKGHYTNSYIDRFLMNEAENYEYDLEELEEKFSNIYRNSYGK